MNNFVNFLTQKKVNDDPLDITGLISQLAAQDVAKKRAQSANIQPQEQSIPQALEVMPGLKQETMPQLQGVNPYDRLLEEGRASIEKEKPQMPYDIGQYAADVVRGFKGGDNQNNADILGALGSGIGGLARLAISPTGLRVAGGFSRNKNLTNALFSTAEEMDKRAQDAQSAYNTNLMDYLRQANLLRLQQPEKEKAMGLREQTLQAKLDENQNRINEFEKRMELQTTTAQQKADYQNEILRLQSEKLELQRQALEAKKTEADKKNILTSKEQGNIITKATGSLKSDQSYKTATAQLVAAQSIKELISSDTALASKMVPTMLRKLGGDSGNIAVAEQESARYYGSLADRLNIRKEDLLSGKLTKAQKKDIIDVMTAYESSAKNAINKSINNNKNSVLAAYDGLDQDRVEKAFSGYYVKENKQKGGITPSANNNVNVPKISTQSEYDKLPSGSMYIAPNGKTMRKK